VTRPRVILADDHKLIAEALSAQLSTEFDIVAVVADGRALVETATSLQPDIIVSDIFMPLLNGLDAGSIIHAESPNIRLVFLSMNIDPGLAAAAFRMGASGYLLKTSPGAELIECLRKVIAGGEYVTSLVANGNVAELLLQQGAATAPQSLSPREKEVLQLLAEGRVMKEVASLLGISTRTVQFHKYRIMDRFHLKSGADLVQFAIRNRMI